jgi:hypothetical protein
MKKTLIKLTAITAVLAFGLSDALARGPAGHGAMNGGGFMASVQAMHNAPSWTPPAPVYTPPLPKVTLPAFPSNGNPPVLIGQPNVTIPAFPSNGNPPVLIGQGGYKFPSGSLGSCIGAAYNPATGRCR